MTEHSEKARVLFEQGYNCSQSVFAAFCDETGMDFETALKLSSSFGGGMGRLREVCGAVTAMFMIAGLKWGYTDPNDDKAKAAHYKLVQSNRGSVPGKERLDNLPRPFGAFRGRGRPGAREEERGLLSDTAMRRSG